MVHKEPWAWHCKCLVLVLVSLFNGQLTFMGYCYGDISHEVTAWTLPDTINSD